MASRGNNRNKNQSAAAAAAADDGPRKERPQTTRGRGGRKDGNDDRRPATGARGDGEGRGRGRGGRGGQQRSNQDPDSWINKFHALQRPKYEDIEFTMDTEIPELPAKEDRLKEPSKDKFEAAMAEIEK